LIGPSDAASSDELMHNTLTAKLRMACNERHTLVVCLVICLVKDMRNKKVVDSTRCLFGCE